MNDLIKKLWYGNIIPTNDSRNDIVEINELRKKLSDSYDNLVNSLDKEQKGLLNEYDEYYIELFDANERAIFEYAFKLGANFAIEIIKE